ncbi:MAG TPA: glycosyltransferase family 4 protein [Firmicutes bacterium]|nr:glycosyltransferase family 4 protein [Bacillota bacterium]
MKIGIDARAAVRYRGTGLGTYTHRLLWALSEVDPYNQYTAFAPVIPPEAAEAAGSPVAPVPTELPQTPNFSVVSFPASPDRGEEDAALSQALAKGGFALHHVPHNGLGFPPDAPCPVVTTIHDLIPYVLPQTCTRRYLERFLARMPEICARSALILTVSRHTRRDLCRILGVAEAKIVVVPEAPEPCYRPLPFSEANARAAEVYGLTGPFLLYVGGFSPRKNLAALLSAYAAVRRDLPDHPPLVLAGNLDQMGLRVQERAKDLGLAGEVLFPGFVPLEDLPYLYRAARFFVYPSLYEGFGLPPLEAMACGTPVIASRESSLPEVVGDAGLLIDPYDPDSLADALLKLASNQEAREALRHKSLQRAKEFSWRRTAAETLLAYEAVAE